MRRRSWKRRAGYTLIESMMALGVLSAGSVAIMGMIQASTRGNLEARQMTTGNQVAQVWVERLRRDGLSWTTTPLSPSNAPQVAATVATTTYLRQVPAAGAAAPWFVPVPAAAGGETANFDFYGANLAGGATPHYCTNVRLVWLFPGQAMRADVRVWWARRSSQSATAGLANCAPGVDPNTLTGNPDVRMVYTSTVIRYSPRPGI
jgi:type IV pilus assembly protein PilV